MWKHSTILTILCCINMMNRYALGYLKRFRKNPHYHLLTQLSSSAKKGNALPIQEWSMEKCNKLPRIYVNQTFHGLESTLQLDEENANYVQNVMRLRPGDYIRVFNEKHGEYISTLIGSENNSQRRRASTQSVSVSLSRLFRKPNDGTNAGPMISLWFAPVKKDKMKFIFEKATELGIHEFQPLVTQNTNVDITADNMQASLKTIIMQSVEQCERMDVPVLLSPISWSTFLQQSTSPKLSTMSIAPTLILVCRERASIANRKEKNTVFPMFDVLQQLSASKTPEQAFPYTRIAIVVGPEGGFTQLELQQLQTLAEQPAISNGGIFSTVKLVTLGEQVLRAETAVLAALSLVSLWKDSHYKNDEKHFVEK